MKASTKLFIYLALSFGLIHLGVLTAELKAEEDVIFRDDFMGKTLRPEWEIKAKDPNRMTLIDNEYLLLVTYGPGSSAKNKMVYKGDLPENYEITVKIEKTPELKFQGVSLGLSGDSKNYMQLYYYIDNITNARAYYGKKLMGEWSEYKTDTVLPRGKTLYLKLTKKGIEYTGAYSHDGGSWTPVGTHIFLNLSARPEFVVYNSQKKVPESGVRIDYFEIKKID